MLLGCVDIEYLHNTKFGLEWLLSLVTRYHIFIERCVVHLISEALGTCVCLSCINVKSYITIVILSALGRGTVLHSSKR